MAGQTDPRSIAPVLHLPWILDIDTTVNPLYGHQQGAQIDYNPHKPGRPSHVYHSYFVATLRISLGSGTAPRQRTRRRAGPAGTLANAGRSAPHRIAHLRPRQLTRCRSPCGLPAGSLSPFGVGCGYGSEKVMVEFESRQLPYLFKLRHTLEVKTLVQQMMRRGAAWQDCGNGWEALAASIRLTGWTRERRLVLVREAPAVAPVGEKARRRRDHQSRLPDAEGEGWDAQAVPWSGRIAVLVSSLDEQAFPLLCMPRLYRERADAENCFDELKNQWGWSGYTTHKLAPSRLMANLIALFYNWWNLYVRFYDEAHLREAITSRPAIILKT